MPMANPQARRTAKPLSLFTPTKELSDWTNADIKKKARVNPRVSEDRLRTRVNTARKAAGKKPLLTVDQQVRQRRAQAKAKAEAGRQATGWTQPQKAPSKTPSRTTKTPSKTTKAGAAKKAKTSFRERRAARLERRIAQPWGSEERKKIQRRRLKRVKGRMAEGGDVKKKSGGVAKKKSGGAVKKYQGGGLSQAQQNMLRQAQEYAASSGQNPAALRKLTAQHGDLYGAGQQKKARSQMAGNQPGRSAMRGIGPGMKSGGAVKKKSGGAVKKKAGGAVKMQGGGLSRAQQNMLRQAQEYAASSGQNPAALRKLTAQYGDLFGASQQKKAKRQLAGSKPGRTSMRGIGPGMKSGGVAKKKSGGAVKKYQGGGLSQAQQNLLRGAQEHAARSGQNPAKLQALTAQHGDLYGQQQQGRARRQMAGNQPGRSAMRGIGPGMKKGGMAKQGANARLDESLGERRGKESKKSQSLKSRRNESRGARKKSKPQSAGVAKRGWGAAIR